MIMEPIAALGLAANIIQIVDFSARMLSRTKEIYNSANGTLKIFTDLEASAKTLEELSSQLRLTPHQGPVQIDVKNGSSLNKYEKLPVTFLGRFRDRRETNQPQYQQQHIIEDSLSTLGLETMKITQSIINTIQKVKSDSQPTAFQSIRHAFRSVWTEQQLKVLEASLESMRRQTDTALLFSVRYAYFFGKG